VAVCRSTVTQYVALQVCFMATQHCAVYLKQHIGTAELVTQLSQNYIYSLLHYVRQKVQHSMVVTLRRLLLFCYARYRNKSMVK